MLDQQSTPPLEPLKYTDYNYNPTTDQLAQLAPRSFITWRPRKNASGTKWSKVPDQHTNNHLEHMTLQQALTQSQMIGLVCNKEHSIIALDLDNVPLDHPQIAPLLKEHPTYIEYSPSGKKNHYRILYTTPSLDDKLANFAPKKVVKTEDGAIEVFAYSNNYITLTGQAPSASQPIPIATIPPATLLQHIPEAAKAQAAPKPDNVHTFPATTTAILRSQNLPSLSEWAKKVPSKKDHPLVKTYCEQHNITYYQYWLQGIMVLHKVGGAMDGYHAANYWSREADDHYDELELEQKWKSFSDEDNQEIKQVSQGTYVYMFNRTVLSWPDVNKAGSPSPNNIANLQALLEFMQITLTYDKIDKSLVLAGPPHVLVPRFYKNMDAYYTAKLSIDRLVVPMLALAREYNFNPLPKVLDQHLTYIVAAADPDRYVNRFELALLQEEPYDPQKEMDYIAFIFGDCLKNDSEEFKHPTREMRIRLGRLWLRSVLRSFESIPLKNPEHRRSPAEAMLIISGENSGIGKTVFCRHLLPRRFEHLLYEPNSELGKIAEGKSKDYKLAGSTALLVNFDECGWLFKYTQQASDFIKQEVTTRIDNFRPPYGRISVECPRRYSLIASTNDSTIQLPREGARRFFWINVTDIDLTAFKAVSKMRLFKQVQYELEHYEGSQSPWSTTEEDRAYLASYLAKHQRTTNFEEILHEMFDSSEESLATKLTQGNNHVQKTNAAGDAAAVVCTMSASDIMRMIESSGLTTQMPSLKEVKMTLKRYLASVWKTDPVIKRSVFRGGIKKVNGQHRYLMPMPMGWQDSKEHNFG